MRVRVGGRGALDRRRGRRPATATRWASRAARRSARRLPRPRARRRCASSLRRYARTHGPFDDRRRCAPRYGVDAGARSSPTLERARRARARRAAAAAARSASGATPTCCASCAAPRWRSCAARSSRSSREALARFLPAWQGVDRHPAAGAGVDRLRDVLAPLQGLPLPPELWERDVLPRRLGAYSPAWLDELCATRRAGLGRRRRASGARRPRGALLPRRRSRCSAPPGRGRARGARTGRVARARARPPAAGACFFTDLLVEHAELARRGAARGALGPRVGRRGHQRRLRAAALRQAPRRGRPRLARRGRRRAPAAARAARRAGRFRRPARAAHAAAAGPLVARPAPCSAPAPRPTRGGRATAPGPSCCSSATASSPASSCAPRASPAASPRSTRRSSALETLGAARRGYFVEGLGGAQFALPGRGRPAARARRPRRRRASCWPPPTPRSSTAPRCPGRTGAGHGRPPAPTRRAGSQCRAVEAAGRARPGPAPRRLRGPARRPPAIVSSRPAGIATRCGPAGPGVDRALGALAAAVREGLVPRLAIEKIDGEPALALAPRAAP